MAHRAQPWETVKLVFRRCGLNVGVDRLSAERREAGGICPATLQPGEDSHRGAGRTNIELVKILLVFVLAVSAQLVCCYGR